MNTKDFQRYLAVYGSDIDVWPEKARRRARAALQRNRDLAAWQGQEKALELALRTYDVQACADDLASRIVSKSCRMEQCSAGTSYSASRLLFPRLISLSWPLRPATALALLALLGFLASFAAPSSSSHEMYVFDTLFGADGAQL